MSTVKFAFVLIVSGSNLSVNAFSFKAIKGL